MKRKKGIVLTALVAAALSGNALAQKEREIYVPPPAPVYQSWMNPEIQGAWTSGYTGQGVTITVVDEFNRGTRYWANMSGVSEYLRHGEWTRKQAGMIAPSATMRSHDFYSGSAVALNSGFNVLNLSYGMMARAGYTTVRWSAQERSIISYAAEGRAVVSKSAGNDGVAVGLLAPTEN